METVTTRPKMVSSATQVGEDLPNKLPSKEQREAFKKFSELTGDKLEAAFYKLHTSHSIQDKLRKDLDEARSKIHNNISEVIQAKAEKAQNEKWNACFPERERKLESARKKWMVAFICASTTVGLTIPLIVWITYRKTKKSILTDVSAT